MIAVTMPHFALREFADAATAWISTRPLLSLLLLAGTLACGFLALVWTDTADDHRGALDDEAPSVTVKVVQIRPEARTYTSEDYREFVHRYEAGEDASVIIRRINERADLLAREVREKRDQRRREQR